MVSVSDPFDRVYYINLDRRKDRNEKFKKNNLDFLDFDKLVRISGYDALQNSHYIVDAKTEEQKLFNRNLGRTAHAISYARPFQDALENGFQKILILEDDAYPLFSEPETFLFYESQEEYDMMYFGGSLTGRNPMIKHSNYLYKINDNILESHSIAFSYNKKIFELFASLGNSVEYTFDFLSSMFVHKGTGKPLFGATDSLIKSLTVSYKTLLPIKLLYDQINDHSDIENNLSNSDNQLQFEKHT